MGQSNSAELLKATEAQRRALLAEIGHRRASAVITYFTTTRPGLDGWESSVHADDIQIVERHVKEARRKGVRNIDLLLCTYGGRATVPWGLVAMIREHLDDGAFRVIAPGEAYSAGACICLGADEVVMGRESVLGPVDSQFPWPRGGYVMTVSASDLQGFMDFLQDQDLPKQAAKGGFGRRTCGGRSNRRRRALPPMAGKPAPSGQALVETQAAFVEGAE